MVELVDTRDLKSLGHRLCRFKPGSGYQKISSGYRDNSVTAYFIYIFSLIRASSNKKIPANCRDFPFKEKRAYFL